MPPKGDSQGRVPRGCPRSPLSEYRKGGPKGLLKEGPPKVDPQGGSLR